MAELEIEVPEQTMKSKKERREEYEKSLSIVQETRQRKWMERHGARKFVQFNDEFGLFYAGVRRKFYSI